MKTLQDAIEKIEELRGENLAIMALSSAIVETLSAAQVALLFRQFDLTIEAGRATLNASELSDSMIAGFESAIASFEVLR